MIVATSESLPNLVEHMTCRYPYRIRGLGEKFVEDEGGETTSSLVGYTFIRKSASMDVRMQSIS
jgi:hypothetical protein